MKICCVFNYNPLYRFPIYSAMGDTFDCDFFFGDSVFEPLKQFDPTSLKGFVKYIKARKIFLGYIWHSGIRNIFSTKYDVFIIGGSQTYVINWLVMIYAKIFRKKILYWTHGFKKQVNLKKISVTKLYHSMIDQYLVYNEYNTRYMVRGGISQKKINFINNSLDTEKQTQIYKTLSPSNIYREYFKNDNPTILYIGRIQRVKKTEQILEAMSLLKSKGIYLNLVVIGSNVDDDIFDKKLMEYKLEECVWMYGPCFEEKKNAELIYNAKVCVSPGNVGLTCIHVLSYGTPVVTNNNLSMQMPEFEAIVEGKTGSFFQENDIEDLAKHIQHWISLSDKQRMECRSIARKTIEEKWSVNYQIEILKKLLLLPTNI